VLRYFSPQPTDWQDEFSVFLLIGVTFMAAAWVQSQRGHIGIEAVAHLLRLDRPAAPARGRLPQRAVCASLPGNPGRCCTRPGQMVTSVPRRGRRRVDSLSDDGARHVAAHLADPVAARSPAMSVLQIGLLYGGATLLAMFSGMPIAFALGLVATVFMVAFMRAPRSIR